VIVLPKEYQPQHTYPLLVVLHSETGDAEKEARWWAGDADREGQAQRRGFITIAPRYAQPKQEKHEYDVASHRAVLGSIRHALRTHRIDANRIVLAGHRMGADACFDLGMSHPDIFAGVAPICGKSQKLCHYYYENAKKMPWYVVAGQRDRDTVSVNMRDLNRYFSTGADIIYCEFKERGYETYAEELPRLMDWAETVRRKPLSEFKAFKVGTLRSFDNRFHWVQAGTLPADMFEPIIWENPHKKINERSIDGKITARGGTIYINHPGKTTTLWLSPENLPYDKVPFDQRVHITINGDEKYNGIPKPTVEALLEDLRIRADRQRLFWVRIDL
jgi:predicted esterase